MPKTSLRNADRDAIRFAVIEHKFRPLEVALRTEENALAYEARSRAYKGHLAAIEKLPDGALKTTSNCTVNAGGKRIKLEFEASVRMFYKDTVYYADVLSLPDDDDLAVRVLSWAERNEQLKTDRRHLAGITEGTLAAFRTFDDLLTAWPEAEPFIKARWQTRPEYSANVPAVQLKDLSSALDLPPETVELAQAA